MAVLQAEFYVDRVEEREFHRLALIDLVDMELLSFSIDGNITAARCT
jgi:hypothetical protein